MDIGAYYTYVYKDNTMNIPTKTPPDVWSTDLHKKNKESLYYMFVCLTRPAHERLTVANNVYDQFVSEVTDSITIHGLSI